MHARLVGRPKRVESVKEVESSVDLRDYVAILRRQRWLILAFAALGLVGALLRAVTSTPVYSATAEVLARPIDLSSTDGDGNLNLETERELIVSTAVARLVRNRIGTSASPSELLERVSVEVPAETEVLQIVFSDPNPETAQRGAEAFAESYLDFRRRQALDDAAHLSENLQLQISQLEAQIRVANQTIATTAQGTAQQSNARLQRDLLVSELTVLRNQLASVSALAVDPGEIIGHPLLPTSPSSPNYLLSLTLGLFFGAFGGATVAFVRDRLDDRIRSRSELQQIVGAPVLATIPEIRSGRPGDDGLPTALAVAEEPNGAISESYRRLRGAIQMLSRERPIRTIMVTSPLEREGKTTTAANLGVAFAHSGRRVILVSADLRRPRAHQLFGLENASGLSEVLTGEKSLTDVLQNSGVENLGILLTGSVPSEPDEALDSERMAGALEELGEHAELLIVDSPPVLAVADAMSLVPVVDAVLLVARHGVTTRLAVQETRAQLERAGATLLGCVLTDHHPAKNEGYEYSYFDEGSVENGEGVLSRLLRIATKRRT